MYYVREYIRHILLEQTRSNVEAEYLVGTFADPIIPERKVSFTV